MQQEFFKRIFCLLLVFLIVNPLPVFAAALEFQEATPKAAETDGKTYSGTVPETTRSASFSCNTERLSDAERQRLWDETLKKGFVGKELNAGTPPNPGRQGLDTNTLIIPSETGNTALKQQAPTLKIKPEEIAHLLNTYFTGAFAFGLVLDDSLRTGRCRDLNIQGGASCALLGENLYLRNTDQGIVKEVKNAFNAAWEYLKPGQSNELKEAPEGVSKENLTMAKAELVEALDDNRLEVQTAKRVKSQMIPNSILTDSFKASISTNCTNASCMINTYSMFDKLFNKWMSTTMLVSNFGPTIIGSLGRASLYFRTNLPREIKIGNVKIPTSIKDSALVKRIRAAYTDPDHWWMNLKFQRQRIGIDKYGLSFDSESLVPAQAILRGGTMNWWWPQQIGPNGPLPKVLDPVTRGHYWNYFKNWRDIGAAYDLSFELAKKDYAIAMDAAKKIADPAQKAAAEKLARRTLAGKYGGLADHLDDHTGLDMPDFITKHKSVNWQKYAVRRMDTGDFIQPAVDSDYTDIIFKKLNSEKHLGFTAADAANPKMRTWLQSRNNNLVLYTVDPAGTFEKSIARAELETAISQSRVQDLFAKLDNGEMVPYMKQNIDTILKNTSGDVQLFRSGWKEAKELTPDELSDLLLGPRVGMKFARLKENTERMLEWATANGWRRRSHYGGLLDQAFAAEQNLLKSYLHPVSGAKLTAIPFAYWGFKRGFGNEAFSLYALPDTWSEVKFTLGEQQLYQDAFIDFFANEGSDQGDVFLRALNALPWKQVYDAVAANFKPLKNTLDMLTKNELRNKTGNLAYYTSGPEQCDNCGIALQSKGLQDFSPFFFSGATLSSFVLEDTPSDQKEIGQTLIGFAHHTNLEGKTQDIEGGGINLAAAQTDKKTCKDKIEQLNLMGLPLGSLFSKLGMGPRGVGFSFAFGEAILYATMMWAGFLGSAVQQIMIMPQLQDCVDDEEGYFAHVFVPKIEKKNEEKSAPMLSTDKVSEMIEKGKQNVLGMFQGDANSMTQQNLSKAKQGIENLIYNAKTQDIVEGIIISEGYSTGSLKGPDLFYLWIQGGTELNPTEYRTEGKHVVSGKDTNITFDFKNGIVYVNGQPIITNPDITRLVSTNTKIPADEIPNTITKLGLPTEGKTLMFQLNVKGNFVVIDASVLDCIKQGVLEQTGVPLSSSDLTEVFGNFLMVGTDTHPNVYIDSAKQRIVAEGAPRKIAEGPSSRVDIYSNRETLLFESMDGSPGIGKFKSIQFENGFLLFKPETNELIVWLKRNEKATMNQDEVQNLLANKTTSKNPLTNCDEPAIDLEVKGNPDSELAQSKAELLNESLQKMGPFKIFDTPTKRFIFYAKLEGGECKDYFKVINKDTGEVLVDAPIKSIEQTPTGIKVTTEDGKEHKLDFSAEEGKPVLRYNNYPPEVLQTAQGQNGAFWYDPATGQWHAENAQLLPLLEAFRDRGISTQANPDGTVTSTASGNQLNVNIGSGTTGPFNLASMPEGIALFLFMAGIVATIVVIRRKIAS